MGARHYRCRWNQHDLSSNQIHHNADYYRYRVRGQRVGTYQSDDLRVVRPDLNQLQHHRGQLEREFVAIHSRRAFLLVGQRLLGACQSGVWTVPYNRSFQVYMGSSSGTETQTQVVAARFCALVAMKAAQQWIPSGSTPSVGSNSCVAVPTGSTWQLTLDNEGVNPPSFCGFTCLY